MARARAGDNIRLVSAGNRKQKRMTMWESMQKKTLGGKFTQTRNCFAKCR